MPSVDHLHTYERIKGSKDYFRCLHPDCTSTAPKKLLLMKRALCRCGEIFILTKIELEKKTPKCQFCIKSRNRVLESMRNPVEVGKSVEDLLSTSSETRNSSEYEI